MSMFAPSRAIALPSTICRSCRLRLLRLNQDRQLLQQHQQQAFLPISQSRWGSIAKRTRPSHVSNVSGQKSDDNAQNLPRWAATPSAMRAPHRIRPKSDNDEFPVNEDPEKLRQTYITVLGNEEAAESLPERLRWLAVTHKSFDHGRRGFNDRLAFLGRRLVAMQTSLALLDAPQSRSRIQAAQAKDGFGREPSKDEALMGLANINLQHKILAIERLSQLAQRYGLADVIRWKPRQIRDLKTSGMDSILAHTLYAVIGAVALQRGGAVAIQTVRKRILNPLGVMESKHEMDGEEPLAAGSQG